MSIFSKRNALVGFLTLKALEQRRRRRKRSVARTATLVVLGVISVGVLAALAAVVVRKQRGAGGEASTLEGYAVGEEAGTEEGSAGTSIDASAGEPGFAA